MGLWRSSGAVASWSALALTATMACGTPMLLGGLAMIASAVMDGFGTDWQLLFWMIATVMLFSPLYSWVGFVLAVPAIRALQRRGRFGWGQTVLLAAGISVMLAALLDLPAALWFGVPLLLVMRLYLRQIFPLML